MSSCEKYQELISAMLDGELSTEKTVELSVHLAKCPECRAVYEAFSAISEANAADMQELPAGLHDRIMTGVRAGAKGKKRGIMTYLRPYVSAAACVAVIIAAVLAVRSTGILGGAGSSAPMAKEAAASEAYSYASDTAPAAEAAYPADQPESIDSGALFASPSDAAPGDAEMSAESAEANEKSAHSSGAGAPVPEPALSDREYAARLDIASATVVTQNGTACTTEKLDATDSRVWLMTLVESGLKFADGEDTGSISYEFTAERLDGSEYTVYLFYDENGLRASLDKDRAESVQVETLGQLAALTENAE
jgi:hypothetical protein